MGGQKGLRQLKCPVCRRKLIKPISSDYELGENPCYHCMIVWTMSTRKLTEEEKKRDFAIFTFFERSEINVSAHRGEENGT